MVKLLEAALSSTTTTTTISFEEMQALFRRKDRRTTRRVGTEEQQQNPLRVDANPARMPYYAAPRPYQSRRLYDDWSSSLVGSQRVATTRNSEMMVAGASTRATTKTNEGTLYWNLISIPRISATISPTRAAAAADHAGRAATTADARAAASRRAVARSSSTRMPDLLSAALYCGHDTLYHEELTVDDL